MLKGLMKEKVVTKEKIFDNFVLFFSAIITIFTLAWVLRYCYYGIDFTDESHYLIWIANPFKYKASVTQFGFIYHPFYKLFNGDIALLRQINIFITYCLSWILCNVFLKNNFSEQFLPTKYRLVVASAIATAGVVVACSVGSKWLSTPSYNTLSFQSLLILAIGLLVASREFSFSSLAGWFLIGFGGWLVFMAKPTTAIFAGFTVLCYLFGSRKFNIRLIMVSVCSCVALVILFAFIVDGSITSFVYRMIDGLELSKGLGAGYQNVWCILRLDFLRLNESFIGIILILCAIIFFSAYFSQSNDKKLRCIAFLMAIGFGLVSMVIVFGFVSKGIGVEYKQGTLNFSICFAVVLTSLLLYRIKGFLSVKRSQWFLAFAFLMFTYAFPFGTNGNYWTLGSSAGGIFWVLASLVFLKPTIVNNRFSSLLLSIGFAAQLISVIQVHNSIQRPYRQPTSFKNNDSLVEFSGSKLKLSRSYAGYIEDLINLADKIGFEKGNPVIDLTGMSPGTLYVLGANVVGLPWLIGGYPGSNAFVEKALEMCSCEELARSWVLIYPKHLSLASSGSLKFSKKTKAPRMISPDVISSFGANLFSDFEIAGTIETPVGMGGYYESFLQVLLRPVRSSREAIEACLARSKSQE